MLIFIFLLLMEMHSIAAVTHSLKYFYTGLCQVKNFPEFVAVALVDDVQIIHYDSITQRCEPTADWMKVKSDEWYWEGETQRLLGEQLDFEHDTEIAKQCFNQTGGVHIFQRMSGCEWNDETKEVTVYDQYRYDREDWIAWDVKENRWIAAKEQAEIMTNKWNNNKAGLEYRKDYLNQICPEWLKKFVDYGRSSLMRTDLPSVSFLQKSSSSPVSCHASGFYPNRAEMFWRKDGEEVHGGVVKGEILPNNDGTFQMSVDIDLSSVGTEDWNKYECVFQLSGVTEDIVRRLEKTTRIRNNESNDNMMIILVVAAALVPLCLIGVVGFILYKKKNAKRPPSYFDTKILPPSPEISPLTSGKSSDYQGNTSSGDYQGNTSSGDSQDNTSSGDSQGSISSLTSGNSDNSHDSTSSNKPLIRRKMATNQ